MAAKGLVFLARTSADRRALCTRGACLLVGRARAPTPAAARPRRGRRSRRRGGARLRRLLRRRGPPRRVRRALSLQAASQRPCSSSRTKPRSRASGDAAGAAASRRRRRRAWLSSSSSLAGACRRTRRRPRAFGTHWSRVFGAGESSPARRDSGAVLVKINAAARRFAPPCWQSAPNDHGVSSRPGKVLKRGTMLPRYAPMAGARGKNNGDGRFYDAATVP